MNSRVQIYFRVADRSTKMWQLFITVLLRTIINILVNPSFWIFCILALGIGSLGLWIGVFYEKGFIEAIQSSGRETILTFCIALLGGVAVEQYFNRARMDGYKHKSPEENMREHIAILGWNSAFVMTFYGFFNKEYWFIGLLATILFWISYTIYNPIFDHLNKKVLDGLRIKYENKEKDSYSDNDENESDLGGKGL